MGRICENGVNKLLIKKFNGEQINCPSWESNSRHSSPLFALKAEEEANCTTTIFVKMGGYIYIY